MEGKLPSWWIPVGLFLGILFWGAVAFEGVHPLFG
jgi:hypothetical protein